jgi:hypothetical protein
MTNSETLERLLRNKKLLFAGAAAIGGALSAFLTTSFGFDGQFASWVLGGALDAAIIGAAVVYAQNYYQTKSFHVSASLKKAVRVGLIAGCAGGLAAMLSMYVLGAGNFGRLVGWAISGGVAGFVVSGQVPNLMQKPAVIAGAIGGAIGCLFMYMDLGYTTGVAITGAAIGLMVATAEVMFRKNWLEVEIYAQPLGSGLNFAKPVRQFTLNVGTDPITVGTRDDLDLQLNRTAGVAGSHTASIYCEGEKTVYHDLLSGSRTELSAGQPFRFGECQVRLGS